MQCAQERISLFKFNMILSIVLIQISNTHYIQDTAFTVGKHLIYFSKSNHQQSYVTISFITTRNISHIIALSQKNIIVIVLIS